MLRADSKVFKDLEKYIFLLYPKFNKSLAFTQRSNIKLCVRAGSKIGSVR